MTSTASKSQLLQYISNSSDIYIHTYTKIAVVTDSSMHSNIYKTRCYRSTNSNICISNDYITIAVLSDILTAVATELTILTSSDMVITFVTLANKATFIERIITLGT